MPRILIISPKSQGSQTLRHPPVRQFPELTRPAGDTGTAGPGGHGGRDAASETLLPGRRQGRRIGWQEIYYQLTDTSNN